MIERRSVELVLPVDEAIRDACRIGKAVFGNVEQVGRVWFAGGFDVDGLWLGD